MLTVVAGLVGSGLDTFGHSFVVLERDGESYVLDPSGQPAGSSLDELTLVAFTEQTQLLEFIRYSDSATSVRVDSIDLANFSTSSNYNDNLNEQFQAVFGTNKDFSTVTSNKDADYTIDTYDSLIQKVIALEMQRLIESGNTQWGICYWG